MVYKPTYNWGAQPGMVQFLARAIFDDTGGEAFFIFIATPGPPCTAPTFLAAQNAALRASNETNDTWELYVEDEE